jgi:hypothetical protein
MKRTPKLAACYETAENDSLMGTKTPDRFAELLDSYASDITEDELSAEELDALYSKAVADGLIGESEIDESFVRFLGRTVSTDSPRASLSPLPARTLGACLTEFCSRRSRTLEQVGSEFGILPATMSELGRSTAHVDPERFGEMARSLAAELGNVSTSRLHTLLQAVRTTLEIGSASGLSLAAARRLPKT